MDLSGKTSAESSELKIAFQGALGAYSHKAIADCYPNACAIACDSFESAILAVQQGRADYAMTPIENSIYGRVPDIHRLLPESGLHIIGEHYVRVEISLLAVKGARLEQVKTARSHPVYWGNVPSFCVGKASPQSAILIRRGRPHGLPNRGIRLVRLWHPVLPRGCMIWMCWQKIWKTIAIIPRGLSLSRPNRGLSPVMAMRVKTSFIFRVRNIPAALYKALGGFATNGVNMVKLESYMLDGSFAATQFYADIIGHPEDEEVARALDELGYYTDMVKILGVYPAGIRYQRAWGLTGD